MAQEEERIKEVREVSEAERMRQVTVINAQAEAEESLVRQVKKPKPMKPVLSTVQKK